MSVRNAYPAFRIFIFGEEVSQDCLSVTVNWADDTRAPSTAQFALSNKPTGTGVAQSRYVIEPEDIMALYPNDLTPTQVLLPDVRSVLANDPRFLSRAGQGISEALNGSLTGGFGALLGGALSDAGANLTAARNSVIQNATEQYNTLITSAENDLTTQVRQRLSGVPDDVKRRLLLAKFDKAVRVEQPALTETGSQPISDIRRANSLKGTAARYPYWAGHPIFHSNDPVRIFFRDPFDGQHWYHMFAGFISDWTVSRGVNGEVTVSFVCEDVLRILRYARFVSNPGIFDIAQLKQDEDFVIRTFFNDNFANLSLTELLYTVIFGPVQAGTVDALQQQGNINLTDAQKYKSTGTRLYQRFAANGGSSDDQVPAFGCGAFNYERSITCILGPTPTIPDDSMKALELLTHEARLTGPDALGVYQAIVDHEVRSSDLDALLLRGQTATPRSQLRQTADGDVTISAVITEIGENPHRYPVDGGRLVILAPASLGPGTNRKILEKDFVNGFETQTTFKSRLFVLLGVLSRIEFCFYATPRGDILAEMPLYDFDPANFSAKEITPTLTDSQATGAIPDMIREIAAHGAVGPFEPHYRVARRDIMDSGQTFADEKIRTQFKTSWQALQSRANGITSDQFGAAEVVTLRPLVPQFGLRDDTQPPPNYVASPEAAQVFAHLHLNKANADALTTQLDSLPMLRMGPNRPIEVSDGTYMGTLRSVSRSINWEGHDMTQTVGINYTRVWDGLIDDHKRPIYNAIGGSASRPMNYGILFRSAFDAPSGKDRTTAEALSAVGSGEVA